MARGGRGAGNKRKAGDGSKKLTKKQKKDLQEYGELHPADHKATGKEKYKTVRDEEASYSRRTQGTYGSVRTTHEDEAASAYQQLLASIVSDALDSGSEDDGGPEEVEQETEEPEQDQPLAPAEVYNPNTGGQAGEDEDAALLEGDSDNEEAVEPGLPSKALDEHLETDPEDYRAVGLLDEEDEEISRDTDLFSIHFERDLPEDLANRMTSQPEWCRAEMTLPQLGNCQMSWPQVLQQPAPPASPRHYTLQHMHVKRKLTSHIPATNAQLSQGHQVDSDGLTHLQHSVFSVLNSYQDLLFCDRDHRNGEHLRLTYCVHALNHVLKTKSRVVAHNSKIKSRQDQLADYRDQGLTRPKVLIVVPFRDAALRIVRLMSSLLMPDNQKFVSNKKRFEQEYGEEETMQKGKKPEDFEATFSGNMDDHFRIGIGIAKKTIKLYSEFYSSDIIIASPLGLRTIIGAEGDENRDYDFLSSIEVLIFDQVDVFLMQNWEHVLHLMNHLNVQPKEPHGVDFSRVRMWTLNGWSRLYRQTIMMSNISFPELHSLYNVYGHNFAGKVLVPKAATGGSICQIVAQLPQVFQQITTHSMEQLADARFNYFVEKVLSEHKDPVMAQTLIYIPSYFDYVRLRNYFKKEKLNFVHLCEYSSQKAISRARAKFYHGKAHFMLFTERLHFFKRYQLRGISHLIFYELPHYSHFYSEFCNMLLNSGRQASSMAAAAENLTCTVIYSRYEAHQLSDVVGRQRASHMLQSQKTTHMFVTGDNNLQ